MAVTPEIARALRWPLALTRMGMVAERLVRAFWPLWSVLALWAGLWLIGYGGLEGTWLRGARAGLAIAAVLALGHGVRRFRTVSRSEAAARLEARMPGRPLSALADRPAVGGGALWAAHQARMTEAARAARAGAPDLRVSQGDPYGLRYMAAIFLAMAVLFGSGLRVASGSNVVLGPEGTGASGPAWEGWAEPPRYTGRPTIYLNEQDGALSLPEGSALSFRLYGEAGRLAVEENVSAGEAQLAGESPRLVAAQSGRVAVTGPGGRGWDVTVEPDLPPEVALTGLAEGVRGGGFALPFAALDDFGLRRGRAEIRLNLPEVERRYGLKADPVPQDPVILDLPMPFSGPRDAIEASLSDDLSEHVWANMPVTVTLVVEDAAGQEGRSDAQAMVLPGRRFFEPFAAAVAEQRRDLLWAPEGNGMRVAQVLRALAWGADAQFRKPAHRMALKAIIDDIEALPEASDPAALEQISEKLWVLALELEEGALQSARERLERARERLAEAMRNGASPAEIAELMDELRAATDAYMDLMASQAEPAEDRTDRPDQGQDQTREVEMDEIEQLMEEIQKLMEEGRMEEAAVLMEQLNALLDNLQFRQSDGAGEGRRQMEQMDETLRDQQDLSDDAFRQLQDQFNGRQPQQDSSPQSQDGAQGTQGDQGGSAPGEMQRPEGPGGEGQEGDTPDLAERQRQLRQALEDQRQALPGLTGEAADAAREAMEEAAGAMEEAEDALRNGDLPRALDGQARALDALREAMDQFGQALEDEARGTGTEPRDGAARENESLFPDTRDPLGRRSGSDGGKTAAEEGISDLEGGEDRSRALTEELRRRAGELDRPKAEREYLERLLEHF